jgi:hypothetical protein
MSLANERKKNEGKVTKEVHKAQKWTRSKRGLTNESP